MLREGPGPRDDGSGSDASADAQGAQTDLAPVIRCAACGSPVAHGRDRTERFGAHVHDRVNPDGYAFTLGLFARADGARLVGEPSSEFPWFPKHDWQVAVCRACGVQLGWRFRAPGAAAFFALILAQLTDG